MNMHEQPGADLARFVRASDLLRSQTGSAVSCLREPVRATATVRTCPGAAGPVGGAGHGTGAGTEGRGARSLAVAALLAGAGMQELAASSPGYGKAAHFL